MIQCCILIFVFQVFLARCQNQYPSQPVYHYSSTPSTGYGYPYASYAPYSNYNPYGAAFPRPYTPYPVSPYAPTTYATPQQGSYGAVPTSSYPPGVYATSQQSPYTATPSSSYSNTGYAIPQQPSYPVMPASPYSPAGYATPQQAPYAATPYYPFNPYNIKPPQAHLYSRSETGFQPMQTLSPLMMPNMGVYQQIAAPPSVTTPSSNPASLLAGNSTGDMNSTSLANMSFSNLTSDPMVMAPRPEAAAAINYMSNAVHPYTTVFNGFPQNQPFYPPGYGPWNPFVLATPPTPSNTTASPTNMWPSQSQPFYSPPMMNPYFPTQHPQNMPFNGNSNGQSNAMQSDESGTPTVISSNGETGSDINSLPPQVKEFVDMIPDILSMPDSQSFGQGNQPSMGSGGIHRLSSIGGGGMHKPKSSLLYRKKHYTPKQRYYNNNEYYEK